ncbi:MAG: hypothetical protein ACI4N3_01770 [Alphaproteobacteria bacterium]
MIIDKHHSNFLEYPYNGVFSRSYIDESKPLDERVEEMIEILQTKCDIQEAGHINGQFIKATYEIYFPTNGNIPIKNGDEFIGYIDEFEVNGRVVGIFPSSLRGCKCYIDDTDI